MKTAFALVLCLVVAVGCVDDTPEVETLDYDSTTQQATIAVGSDIYTIDVSEMPKPPPDEPDQGLRCRVGDLSECGFAWNAPTGPTICCWW